MTGKSRSMAELASVGVFTFISCFRPQTDAFYRPRRTPKIADWGTKKIDDLLIFTRQACQYFKACLEELLDFLVKREGRKYKLEDLTRTWRKQREKEDRDAPLQAHQDGKTFWGRVWMKMQEPHPIVDQVRSRGRTIEEKAHLVIDKFRRELKDAGLIAKLSKQLRSLVRDLPADKLHILFAFDEARNLKQTTSLEAKDNFVALRRAMRVLPRHALPAKQKTPAVVDELNMFCLVTDTTSAIGNLAPPKEFDPSERAGHTGTRLYHPFVNLMGFDSWWKSAGDVLVPMDSQSSATDVVNFVKTALLPRIEEAETNNMDELEHDESSSVVERDDEDEEVRDQAQAQAQAMDEDEDEDGDQDEEEEEEGELVVVVEDDEGEVDEQGQETGDEEEEEEHAEDGRHQEQTQGGDQDEKSEEERGAVDAEEEEEEEEEQESSSDEPSAKRAKVVPGNPVTASSGPRPFRDLLSMKVLETAEAASMQGRPAFFPNLCARKESLASNDLIQFLISKILRVDWLKLIADSTVTFKPNKTQLMAVLGMVKSIEISAASNLATELSSGHMRPAAGLSRDRHLLYTMEISEAFMAASAREIMRHASVTWSSLLAAFRETQLNSTTLPGFIGEFAGQVLLLMADEKARQLHRLASPFGFYPLLDFLAALLGRKFVDSLGGNVKMEFRGGYVRLLQFVKTFAPLSRKTLLEYLLRSSGVYCREMQPGADLGLGVFFPSSESLPAAELEPVTLDGTSAVLVQIKNWSSPLKPSQVQAAFSKLAELHKSQELSSGLPRVSILLELHRHRSDACGESGDWKVKLHKAYSSKSKILQIHASGLSVSDILMSRKDRVRADAAFRQMLTSIVDPKTVETIPSEFRDLVEKMFTVQPYMAEAKPVPIDKFPLSS